MPKILNITLAAAEAAGAQLLRSLLETRHRVVAVLALESAGRSPGPFEIARSNGIPVIPADAVKSADLVESLHSRAVDLLLNVHSLFVIHPDVLAAPRLGSFNLHPGPLPEYAGLDCPSWAIYNGESAFGVTVHRMVPEIDAGPIAYQARFDLTDDDTGATLSAKCARAGLPLLLELVEAASCTPPAIPTLDQDLRARRYFRRQPPQDGLIMWALPARRIVDFVRAADYYPFPSPWGHPRATLNGTDVGIARARRTGVPADQPPGVVASLAGELVVAAEDEWIAVQRLELDGRYCRPGEVLRPGLRLSDGVVRE